MTSSRATPVAALETVAGYRGDIDGLRAIAVTSVVLFHAGVYPFSSGFVGVDVFFVISGYLIGGILLRETQAGRFSFLRFYARRARRILPALFVVILATCTAGLFLLDASELKDVGVLSIVSLLGVSNINLWQFQDYFADDARLRTLLMTWSLGVEEQFYVIFPILIALVMRFAKGWLGPLLLGVSLASLACSLWWTPRAPAAAFYLLPSRAWELSSGIILAAVDAKVIRGPLWLSARASRFRGAFAGAGLVMLIVAIFAFDERTPFPGFAALLPVVGTCLLIASRGSWFNRHILASRPFVFVGLISYSWYLWHWPVMSFVRIVVPTRPPTTVFLALVVLSFGLAVLSWRFVERPFRQIRHSPAGTLLRYVIALGCVISVPIAVRAYRGFPERLTPRAQAIEANADELKRSRLCLAMNGRHLAGSPSCYAAADVKRIVAAFGDSHAWALSPGLRAMATGRSMGVDVLTLAGCPPLVGMTLRSPAHPELEVDCPIFQAEALKKIVGDPRIEIVLVAGYWSAELQGIPASGLRPASGPIAGRSGLDMLREGLTNTIHVLTAAHKKVIIVQDVPHWDEVNPLRVALADTLPARRTLAYLIAPGASALQGGWLPVDEVPRHEDIRRVIADVADASSDVHVFDPLMNFCDSRRCLFGVDGTPLYFDGNHLSEAGAVFALRGLHF